MRGASMVLGGMSIADKKSTHHHHQTDLSSERERGPDDSDEEDHGRLLTFPHPISITIPYLKVPGSWQIGRLATGRIYLVAARHGKGRGEGREGGREGGSRKGGKSPVQGCALSLAFTVFCFLFLLFWSPDIFWGVLVRFIDLTHFIFPSDSDDESFSPSQSTLGGQIDRTGQDWSVE